MPGAQATFRELCHEKHSYRHCKKLLRKNNHDCYLYTKDVHGGGRFSGGKAIVSIDNKAYARCVLDPKAYLASLRKKTKKR